MPASSSLLPSLRHPSRHGFTMIELAVVITVIGLLIGGIMAGRTIIRSADLKNVMSEARMYQGALLQFRDTYYALPGDMPNATDFWGAITPSADCPTTDKSTLRATCNGNGDYMIEGDPEYEIFYVWHHLRLAELIPGAYTGIPGPYGDTNLVPGLNTPKSKVGSNNGWSIAHMGTVSADPPIFDGEYGHVLMFGANLAMDLPPAGPALTPPEMQNLDTKFDDGKPATGILVTFTGANPFTSNCTAINGVVGSTSTDLDADYNLSSKQLQCSLIYRNIL